MLKKLKQKLKKYNLSKYRGMITKLGLASAGVFLAGYVAMNAANWHIQWLEHSVGKVVIKVLRDGKAQSGGSGSHVQTPSGATYILTNAHVCAISEDGQNVLVQHKNDNRLLSRRIIEVYTKHDLCLVEGIPGVKGIKVADSVELGDTMRAIGYPLLRPLRASLGNYLQLTKIDVVFGINLSESACSSRGGQTYFVGFFSVCVRSLEAVETNIVVYPGSSGSPVVGFTGKLIGVVFAGDTRTNYAYLVPLEAIKDFLKIY